MNHDDDQWDQPSELVEGPSFRSLAEILQPISEELAAMADINPDCESPIETMLGGALKVAFDDRYHLSPQFPLDGFRYDFAVLGRRLELLALIECDGKDFHCTPEQIENDRRKDAAAHRVGAEMFRFTGSDIFRRRQACVDLVIQTLRRR